MMYSIFYDVMYGLELIFLVQIIGLFFEGLTAAQYGKKGE